MRYHPVPRPACRWCVYADDQGLVIRVEYSRRWRPDIDPALIVVKLTDRGVYFMTIEAVPKATQNTKYMYRPRDPAARLRRLEVKPANTLVFSNSIVFKSAIVAGVGEFHQIEKQIGGASSK